MPYQRGCLKLPVREIPKFCVLYLSISFKYKLRQVVFPDLTSSEEAASRWVELLRGSGWTVASSFESISPVSGTDRKKMVRYVTPSLSHSHNKCVSESDGQLFSPPFIWRFLPLSISHLTPLAVATCDEEYGSEQRWDLAINLEGESLLLFFLLTNWSFVGEGNCA